MQTGGARPGGFSTDTFPIIGSVTIRRGSRFFGPVPFDRWHVTREHLVAAILAGQCRILLLGPPGTGKTLLLHDVARLLRRNGWEASLCLQRSLFCSEASATEAEGPPRASLVDEGDQLDAAELAAVSATDGAVLMAGLPSLVERCPGWKVVCLDSLTAFESQAFVRLWLENVGPSTVVWDEDATAAVVALGAGVPRLMASLLQGALWMAEVERSDRVTRRDVEKVAAQRDCWTAGQDGAPGPPQSELSDVAVGAILAGPVPIRASPLPLPPAPAAPAAQAVRMDSARPQTPAQTDAAPPSNSPIVSVSPPVQSAPVRPVWDGRGGRRTRFMRTKIVAGVVGGACLMAGFAAFELPRRAASNPAPLGQGLDLTSAGSWSRPLARVAAVAGAFLGTDAPSASSTVLASASEMAPPAMSQGTPDLAVAVGSTESHSDGVPAPPAAEPASAQAPGAPPHSADATSARFRGGVPSSVTFVATVRLWASGQAPPMSAGLQATSQVLGDLLAHPLPELGEEPLKSPVASDEARSPAQTDAGPVAPTEARPDASSAVLPLVASPTVVPALPDDASQVVPATVEGATPPRAGDGLSAATAGVPPPQPTPSSSQATAPSSSDDGPEAKVAVGTNPASVGPGNAPAEAQDPGPVPPAAAPSPVSTPTAANAPVMAAKEEPGVMTPAEFPGVVSAATVQDPAAGTAAVVPLPSVPAPAVPPAAAAPPTAPPVQIAVAATSKPAATSSVSPATLALLLRRADQLLSVGDVSGARLMFGRAAASGSAAAATAMAKTYDPAFLQEIGAMTAGNPALAAEWYRRAAALGGGSATAPSHPPDTRTAP